MSSSVESLKLKNDERNTQLSVWDLLVIRSYLVLLESSPLNILQDSKYWVIHSSEHIALLIKQKLWQSDT